MQISVCQCTALYDSLVSLTCLNPIVVCLTQIPRDGNRPPPMVELCRSPTGMVPTGVANIRSMFENPSGGKVEQKPVTSPSTAYVEGEVSVISMMKSQSSVKSRRAKFGGASGTSVDDNEVCEHNTCRQLPG